jgi:formamidopyrimidine-DNA glycosylase
MPEGPEVETVRQSLVDRVVGATLGRPWVSRQRLRTPVTSKTLAFLDGARVVSFLRKGKTLVVGVVPVATAPDASSAPASAGVFVRLGMTGRLLIEPARQRPALHTHVRIPLAGTGTELRFVDPRRFGEVVPWRSLDARDDELARLGPDGLSLSADDRAAVAAALRATQRSIKDALLDQRVVAGVGNIYAAEACFVARLSPLRAGASLADAEADRLVRAVEDVLAQGLKNRGTSFSDYVDGDGRQGDNAAALHVFGRQGEACRVCARTIERIVQGARSTFFCPRCQSSPPPPSPSSPWSPSSSGPRARQKRKAAPAAT